MAITLRLSQIGYLADTPNHAYQQAFKYVWSETEKAPEAVFFSIEAGPVAEAAILRILETRKADYLRYFESYLEPPQIEGRLGRKDGPEECLDLD